MNYRLASHVLWALLVLVAFLVGRFFAGDDKPAMGRGSAQSSSSSHPVTGASASATSAEAPVSAPKQGPLLSGADMRVRTFNVLTLPSRRDRVRQLCDVLDEVTKENWREALDAFAKHSESGRRYPEEWRLMLDRVAEVAGVSAIEESLQSSVPTERARAAALLGGWAAMDPKASQAWFAAQSPEQQKALLGDFVVGLARSDPAAASQLNMESPAGEPRDSRFYHLMEAVFQQGGLKMGEELIATMRARNTPNGPVGALYFHQTKKVIEVARSRQAPGEVLEWADRHIEPGGVGPASMREIVSFAAKADAAGTLKWVTDRTDRFTAQHTPVVFPVVAAELLKRDPDQFTGWMNAHPDHPQRDVMASVAVNELILSGNFDAASSWAQAIGDAKVRSASEQSVEIGRQRAAAKKQN